MKDFLKSIDDEFITGLMVLFFVQGLYIAVWLGVKLGEMWK